MVELLGGLGDVLIALPAVHALARRHPGAAVRVLTFAPGSELLTADPLVAEVVAVENAPGAARAAVRRQLASRRPDLAVSTTRYEDIPALLEAGAGRAVTDLWRRPPADEPVGRRFLHLLVADGVLGPAALDTPLAIALTAAERADGRRRLAALVGAGAAHPPVVLVTASGMPVKQWPAERWSELAGTVRRLGHPVLSIGPGPVPAVGRGGEGTVAVPPSDLRGLAALLGAVAGRGGVVVGGDTGPVRLAGAAGARVVGLYGPTLGARYGIEGGTALQGLPGCTVRRPTSITEQECWWSARCPLSATGPACMADLGVEQVLTAVAREVAAARRPAGGAVGGCADTSSARGYVPKID